MPKVILQAHQDMVCAWNSGESHEPTTEVGVPYFDGNNLKGKNINLGADDGIGVGMALAITKSNVAHGPLRMLFTTNEDCGIYGVMALDPQVLDADYLISFDDEDYPKATTGCQSIQGKSPRRTTQAKAFVGGTVPSPYLSRSELSPEWMVDAGVSDEKRRGELRSPPLPRDL